MLRLAHVSDLHLGYTSGWLGSMSTQRTAERDRQLSKLVDAALQCEVHMFLIAGDLFDRHRPDSSLVQYVLGELRRLQSQGVAVVTVPGNHDEITYHDSVYRAYADVWPGVLITSPQPAHVASLSLSDEDVHLYGVAYTGGITSAEQPLRDLPRLDLPGFHIAVFHGSLDTRASERSLPLSSDALATAGYDYVALGHYHSFEHVNKNNTPIVYCGAVEARTFDDPGCGKLLVSELRAGEVRLEQMPLPVRLFRSAEIALGRDLIADISSLADADLALEVTLRGYGDLEITAKQIEDVLQSSFYHLSVVDRTESLPDHVLRDLASERSVRGVFVRRLNDLFQAAENDNDRNLARQALLMGLRAFSEVKQ